MAIYVLLAYGLSWLVWLPYVLAHYGLGPDPGPWLYYLAGLGPCTAAFVAEAVQRGRPGVAELLRRVLDWRTPGRWTVIGALSPFLLFIVAVAGIAAFGRGWPDWTRMGVSDGRAPGLGALFTWLLWMVSYGVGEETGWRGFLLPRLQARRSALMATVLLSVLWAGWHVPAFLFRAGYTDLGIGGMIGFFVGLFSGAIVLTWLFNASGGSVVAVALWHGTWNWLAVSDAMQGPWVAVMSSLVSVWAVLVILTYRPAHLAQRPRTTVPAAT